jgi:hypothetical protein
VATPALSPEEALANYFRKNYAGIYRKVTLQVRRTPRRQTGPYKTNRECRWKLSPGHPDYTAIEEVPRIEAKLFAMALEFDGAPPIPDDIKGAAQTVLQKTLQPGTYRCPITGRKMRFHDLDHESKNPTPGRSSFHVGHVRPRAMGGGNSPDNTYWATDLGNRIQGDKSLHETVRIIVEMGEFQRQRENITWGELRDCHEISVPDDGIAAASVSHGWWRKRRSGDDSG